MTVISDRQTLETIDRLMNHQALGREDYRLLLSGLSEKQTSLIQKAAEETRDREFGRNIYVRGLIEISNNCSNDCHYCGIRRSNTSVERYRLTAEEIIGCCRKGAALGFSTFVLQGGEDPEQNDSWVTGLVRKIKSLFPQHAITLSLGEKSESAYKDFHNAGADRYLLRHETADRTHYRKLHPGNMVFENRINCLKVLKSIGFQTGAGMMVGSPFQTTSHLVEDMMLLEDIKPQMIGVGPFIPAANTPFSAYGAGSVRQTLLILSILRLRYPRVLLPATTALATLSEDGRILGLNAGANVLMPNLTPESVKDKYALYRNKLNSGNEAAAYIRQLESDLAQAGYSIDYSRGDFTENR